MKKQKRNEKSGIKKQSVISNKLTVDKNISVSPNI